MHVSALDLAYQSSGASSFCPPCVRASKGGKVGLGKRFQLKYPTPMRTITVCIRTIERARPPRSRCLQNKPIDGTASKHVESNKLNVVPPSTKIPFHAPRDMCMSLGGGKVPFQPRRVFPSPTADCLRCPTVCGPLSHVARWDASNAISGRMSEIPYRARSIQG